jgi:hypothetical protein
MQRYLCQSLPKCGTRGEACSAALPNCFTLPKTFGRRGTDEAHQRDVKDIVFEISPAYNAWLADIKKELASSRRGGTIKPTLENIEVGLVDFKELAATTRQKMQASFSKGQALGNSRKKAAPAKKTATSESK